MKKIFVFGLTMLIVASFIGCAPVASPVTDEVEDASAEVEEAVEVVAEEEPLEFAYFIVHTENEFMAGLASAVEEAAANAGIKMTVYSADFDPANQISQVESAIAQGVDAVLLQPASFDGVTAAVDALIAADIPFVTFHESVSVQDRVASYVGINLGLIGTSTMTQVVEDLGGSGKIAMMYGELGNTAQIAITDGYNEILADYPGIEVVFDGTANWTTDQALTLAENWLSTGAEIDAIVCNNDGMALGALQAVKSAGKTGEILISGNDGVPQVIDAIKAGEIAATIYTDAKGEAEKAIEVLLMLLNGESVESEYIIPPLVITPINVNEYF